MITAHQMNIHQLLTHQVKYYYFDKHKFPEMGRKEVFLLET